jgi:transposase
MAEIRKTLKRYPTDMTDKEWSVIAPLLPAPARKGRPRKTDLREVVNAIRYLVRTGCGWEMLPINFPPWQTVYWWFREFVRRFLFHTIHDIAVMMDRERAGREASPSAAVIDSQSVKAPMAEKRGFDANKKIVGRKRHIAVDTDGRYRRQHGRAIDPGCDPQALALGKASLRQPALAKAGGAYDRAQLMDKAAFLEFTVEVVRRIEGTEGFHVLPRRWVVERTFGWMTRWRRLVRDYEKRIHVSHAIILVVMAGNLIRRNVHP